jgi:hypothetical protein
LFKASVVQLETSVPSTHPRHGHGHVHWKLKLGQFQSLETSDQIGL